MSFEFKNTKKIVEICGKEYEYKTSLQTQQAREKIIHEIGSLKKEKDSLKAIQILIKSMCDYIEDTFGKGTVDSIFGESGSMNTDYADLLDLTLYIIEETSSLEKKQFEKYKVVPDKERTGKNK